MTDVTHFAEFDGETGDVTSGVVMPAGWGVVSAPEKGEMTIQELNAVDSQAAKAMIIFYGRNVSREDVCNVLNLKSVDEVVVLMSKAKAALSEDAMRELQQARRDHVAA